MELFSLIGLGIAAAALAVVLRQQKPEWAMFVSLAASVLIIGAVCTQILPLLDEISEMLDASSVPTQYMLVVFKALGMCFLVQVASDTCKDAGEGAIASKIEIAGKIMVLVISLPLFRQVLSIVYSLVS